VKRVHDCIRILAEVRKQTNARLLMVGDGPERGPAERLATHLGVQDHVEFLGKQDHVERFIRLAHVLLMPSDMESFGLAALEAMACGVPAVATLVGGVPELITDGEDGFLEEAADVTAQAARVVQLLTDEATHSRMSAAARRAAHTRFCTEKIIPQYEKYYEDVLRAPQ
jgi:N-acetyl-alpha-D-glucosaminyl L-malate synthase BshA